MDDEVRENIKSEPPQPAEVSDASEISKKPRWPVIVSVILVAVLSYLFPPRFYSSFKASRFELNCAHKLRHIGACQLAYQGTNIYKVYGSLKNLQEGNFIEDKYTLYTLIKKYELEWDFYADTATVDQWRHNELWLSGDGFGNTFTIVAYPRAYPVPLHTFAISEDQLIRVCNPENNNPYNGRDDPMVQSWDYYEKLPGKHWLLWDLLGIP